MNRQERIKRAEEIIRTNPSITKRGLQERLKTEFGVGLADDVRRRLLVSANTESVLRRRLQSPSFTRHDREVLGKVLHKTGTTPYLAKAINDQFLIGRDLWRRGAKPFQIRKEIRRLAKASGYLATKTTKTAKRPDGLVKGRIDWWRLLRDERDQAIGAGDYTPVKKPRPNTQKGDIAAQKARYTDKQSTKAHAQWVERERDRVRTWISQKDKAIAVSSGERKNELIAERANLKNTLDNIR